MKHRMSAVALGAFVLVALSGVLLLPSSDNTAHAQSSPSVAVSLSDTSVEQGTAITVTMSFGGLTSDSDKSTTDYVFRADVVGADECEGGGMGQDRYMYRVDEDPETRTATVSADCPPGDYTLRVSLSSDDNTELASASAAFTIAAPSIDISLSPDFVEEGNEIAATMSFGGLKPDSDASTTDYTFRADVVGADDCEGGGLGVDRNINRVDEDPEVRTGTVSADCPAGAYTLRVSPSSAANTELASASAGFFILGAPVVIEPPTLTALSVSHGNPAVDVALSPAFDSETLEYSADVSAERVTIAPTAGDADAAIAYRDGNGNAIADADSTADGQQVDLRAGTNTVKVAVSKDGLTTTYTLTLFRLVTRAASTDTTLVANIYVSTSSFVLNASFPKFAQSFETGSNSGGYNLASVGIKFKTVPTQSSDVEVTIREDDSGDPSDTAFATLTNPATFTISAVNTFTAPANTVLAKDKTYFVHIERVGTYSPSIFNTHSNGESTAEAGWTIGDSGHYYGDSTSAWGTADESFQIQVTGSAVGGTQTPQSSDATLSALSLSGVTLSPTFVSGTTTYSVSVGNSVSSTTVTATPNDSGATAVITPTDADSNTAGHQVDLGVGYTVINVEVTAEDTTTKAYKVVVARAGVSSCTPAAPTDAIWSACLTVGGSGYYFETPTAEDNDGWLSNPDVTVGGSTYTIDYLETRGTSFFLGFASAPGSAASDWVLHVGGESTFAFSAVTPSNAGIYEWTGSSLGWSDGDVVSVWIAAASTDATLSAISAVDNRGVGLPLSPTFNSAITEYAVPVESAVPSITLTATKNHSGATVQWLSASDTELATTAAYAVNPLAEGVTVLKVKVTAQDTITTKTYTITITRAAVASSDATLSELTLSGVTLKPTFVSGTTSYTASVVNSVTSTTVTATPTDSGASAVISPTDADSTTNGHQVSLGVGDTEITVEVTA